MSLMNNYPTYTYISWFGLVIVPNEDGAIPFTVEDGKSSKKYIYWDMANPYVLKDSNEWVEESATIKRIYINENGGGTEVPQTDITLYYNDTGNGGSGVLTGKLVGQFNELNGKFMTISADVEKIQQILGSSESGGDTGALIERLNKIEQTAEGTQETISEIRTEYSSDKEMTELRDNINVNLIGLTTELSKYQTAISNMSKDLEVSSDEKLEISTCQTEILEFLTNLFTYHDTLINRLNSTEEDNSQAIISLNKSKSDLNTAIENLNSNVNSCISDNTIVPSELTLMLNMIAVASVRINEYKNTVSENIILGIGGTVTESLLEINKTASEFNQTISSVVEEIDGENGLKQQITQNATSINQTAEEIKLSYLKYDQETASLTIADNVIKLDAGKVLVTGTLTWDSLDEEAKENLKGKDGTNGTAEYVMLTGDQIIKYDVNGNPTVPTVLITAMTSGIDPNAPSTWSYKNPNSTQWVTISSNENKYNFTLQHDDTIWNDYDSITIRVNVDNIYWDDLTVVKVKDGVDGTDAKYVQLRGEQIFKYSIPTGETDFIPHEENITLIGEKHNITTTGTKWYYKKPTSDDWVLMSEYNGLTTITINHLDSRFFNNNNETVKIKFELGTYDDTITIIKIYDGKDSVMATLTNETHVIPCKSNGDPFSYEGASTTLHMYVGTIDDSDNWTYTSTAANLRGTLSNNGRTFTVTEITAEIGYVDIVATKNLFDSFTRRFTVSKSINGIDGSNGRDGTAYWLVTTANTVKKEESVETIVDEELSTEENPVVSQILKYIYTPNEITLNGKSQSGENDIADVNGKFVISELIETPVEDTSVDTTETLREWKVAYTSKALENTVGYVPNELENIVSIRIQFYSDLEETTLLDEQNITVLSDGKEGGTTPVATLDNETHAIPCNFAGYPQSYNGATSTISVYVGTLDDSENWVYSIELTDIKGIASNYNRTFTVTEINNDVGYVDFIATKEGFDSISKRFTLSKVRYGEDGEGAKYVIVTGEQTFKYNDNFTGEPSPSTITLTATRYNISTVGKWQYKAENGNYIDLGVNSDTLTVTPILGDLDIKNVCVFRYVADECFDEITIIKISDGGNGNDGSDGQDGLYVLLTNESHTVPCDEYGNYLETELAKAKTEIHVYKGLEEVDYTVTYTSIGCESIFNKTTKTLTLTKLTELTATVDMTITVEGKTFNRVMTITKALRGATGKDGAGINVIGELGSVNDLPNDGEPGDAYLIDGKLYVWQENSGTWSDGMDIKGEQGLPGKDGVDGRTTYFHIKYSDDGVTFTSNNGETVGKWLGQYVDFYETDSNVFSDYTWKKIVGEDGDNSIVANLSNDSHVIPTSKDGTEGKYTGCSSKISLFSGAETLTNGVTYSVAVSNGISGTWDSSTGTYTVSNMSTDEGYVDLTARYNGIAYTKRFTISKSKQGENGEDSYTINLSNDNHSFVANSEGNIEYRQTTSTTITAYKGIIPQEVTISSLPTVNGLTITKQDAIITIIANVGNTLAQNGTFNITVTVDGQQFIKQFTYSKVNCGVDGKDGANGTDGVNGINGADGKDGKTYYTWIKYSDYEDGTNLYDSPNDNTLYIGIAVNKEVQLESTNKSDYKWSKFRGDDGVDGYNGEDGLTYYTWMKYADDAVGNGISNDSTGKKYIGLAYNKLTATESNNPSDYTWTLIKGEDGVDGEDSYTIYLTNEAHCFTCDEDGTISTSQQTTTIVKAFKGTVEKTPVLGTINSPTGLTITKSGATIAISANQTNTLADSGAFNIPFTIDGRSFVKTFSWSKSYKGANGYDGESASYVVVTGEQTFKYSNNFTGNPTPTSITLNVSKFNISTTGKWQYLNDSGTYVDLGVTSDTLTVTPTLGTLSSKRTCTFRYVTGAYYDTITIAKISDGSNGSDGVDGTDAYSVLLTNECHSFPCESDGTITQNIATTTVILAYKGASPITPTIGNITVPSGMSVSKSGSTLTITALKGLSLDPVGLFEIPITVEGITFIKTFSWSKSYKGANGLDGNDLVLPSWITEWNSTVTEISGSKVLTPKIFAGEVVNGVPTGVAMGKDVLGTTGSYTNVNGIVGYKSGTRTYTFNTDGTALIGTNSTTGNRLYWNGSRLEIVADSIKIGSETVATETYTSELVDTKIDSITIGGRNLLLNSGLKNNSSNWTFSTNVSRSTTAKSPFGNNTALSNQSGLTADAWRGIKQNYRNITIGKTYTAQVAFLIETDHGLDRGATLEVICFKDEGTTRVTTFRVGIDTTTVDKWQILTKTFTVPAETLFVQICPFVTRNGKMYIGDMKLEEGNKATSWTSAPEDTETLIDDAIADMTSDLQSQIDGKIQTYYQTTDPSTSWVTDVIRTQHTGDLWQNSSTNYIYRWSGSTWVQLKSQEATNASVLAQSKAQVFTSTPTIPYYKGDLWITNLSGSGVIKTCNANRTTGSYVATEWVEGLKYIDESTAESVATSQINKQTQTDIFNKLTNNGVSQGIYLQDGKVYINGSYLKSGVINGEYIDARNLNVSGKFNIDSSGNVLIGASRTGAHIYWDGTNLEIQANSIKMGTSSMVTQDDLNNMSIGGNNILKNTDFSETLVGWSAHSCVNAWATQTPNGNNSVRINSLGNNADVWHGLLQYLPYQIQPNETYTFSCYYKCFSTDSNDVDITISDGIGVEIKGQVNESMGEIPIVALTMSKSEIVHDGNWRKIEFTFTMPSTAYINQLVYIWVKRNGRLYVGDIQLEKGNKATAWKKSYRDVESYTQTLVTQAEDRVTYEFKSNIGNPNLSYNGCPTYKNYTGWGAYRVNIYQGHEYLGFYPSDGASIPGCIQSPEISCSGNTTYSISFLIRAESNVTGYYAQMQVALSDGTYQYPSILSMQTYKDNVWRWVRVNYTTPSNASTMRIEFYNNGYTGDVGGYLVSVNSVMVLRGQDCFPSRYYSNYNEIQSNTTTISGSGVEVRHSNGARALLNSGGLYHYDTSGNLYSMINDGKFAFTDSSGNWVGIVGRNTWTNTNTYMTFMGGIYGNTVAIGCQQEDGQPYICDYINASYNTSVNGFYYYQGSNLVRPSVHGTLSLSPTGVETTYRGQLYQTTSGQVVLAGDNELALCIRGGDTNIGGLIFVERDYSPYVTAHFQCDLYMNNHAIYNCSNVSTLASSVTVLSTLSASEDDYSSPNAEVIEQMYGTNSLTEDEIRWSDRQIHHTTAGFETYGYEYKYACLIEIPYYMAENIQNDYHVAITPCGGFGQFYVRERNPYYFVVVSDVDNFGFSFEVVATRLEMARNNAVIANESITKIENAEEDVLGINSETGELVYETTQEDIVSEVDKDDIVVMDDIE